MAYRYTSAGARHAIHSRHPQSTEFMPRNHPLPSGEYSFYAYRLRAGQLVSRFYFLNASILKRTRSYSLNKSTIIYCPRVKDCDKVCKQLRSKSVRCVRYVGTHHTRPGEQATSARHWDTGTVDIIVATVGPNSPRRMTTHSEVI